MNFFEPGYAGSGSAGKIPSDSSSSSAMRIHASSAGYADVSSRTSSRVVVMPSSPSRRAIDRAVSLLWVKDASAIYGPLRGVMEDAGTPSGIRRAGPCPMSTNSVVYGRVDRRSSNLG